MTTSAESSHPANAPSGIIGGLAVILLTLLAYANTFQNEFVWDDVSSVLLHQGVQDPAKILSLFQEDQHAYAGGQGNFYRPLLAVTFMLDYGLATGFDFNHPEGTEPSTFPFHLSSILWHAAAAFLLWLLCLKLRASLPLATAAALIYTVHPLHTEAVAYISGRADSMSAALMFGGLLAILPAASEARKWWRPIVGTACFAAALMSKESALIFPVLVFLCLFFRNPASERANDSRKPFAIALIPLFVTLAIYATLRSTVLSFGSDSGPISSTFTGRVVDSLQSLALYLRLIFWPTHLHMERTLTGATTATTLVGTIALFALLAGFLWALKTRRNLIALGVAWFVASWIPISGIFPLNAPMAEHWLYVPLGGFLLALLALLEILLKSAQKYIPANALNYGAAALLSVFLLFLFAQTVTRNRDWHDNETLYVATLRENPNTTRIHYNLAVTYGDLMDNNAGAKRHYREVIRLYEQKRQSDPFISRVPTNDELESHLSLENIYLEEDNLARAHQHLQSILANQPNDSNRNVFGFAAYIFGQHLANSGQQNEAQEYFRLAVQLYPEIQTIAH